MLSPLNAYLHGHFTIVPLPCGLGHLKNIATNSRDKFLWFSGEKHFREVLSLETIPLILIKNTRTGYSVFFVLYGNRCIVKM